MYAVIDIGSNTIKLNIYEVEGDSFHLVLKNKVSAGLVNYIKNKKLSKAGIDLAVRVIDKMYATCRALQLEKILCFATAPFRNIKNTEEVLAVIKEKTNVDVTVLTGLEEAEMAYRGALYDVKLEEGLVVDIGGGSTELVHFTKNKIKEATSLSLGSLSLFTKYVDVILPKKKELKKIEEKVSKELAEEKTFKKAKFTKVAGVGGSLRAALKLNNHIQEYDNDNNSITSKELAMMLDMLTSNDQLAKKLILRIAPERIHTLLPGMQVLQVLVDKFEVKEILVSQFGVREGYLAKYLESQKKKGAS